MYLRARGILKYSNYITAYGKTKIVELKCGTVDYLRNFSAIIGLRHYYQLQLAGATVHKPLAKLCGNISRCLRRILRCGRGAAIADNVQAIDAALAANVLVGNLELA
jgi:hypothetical protein